MGTLHFTTQEFSILDLSSLHPYVKPCSEHTARRCCTLLGDVARCLAAAHNCSVILYGGRTMIWTARFWFAPARKSSRRRCTTGTRRSETSYGGYNPGYPRQVTWAMPPGRSSPQGALRSTILFGNPRKARRGYPKDVMRSDRIYTIPCFL